MGFLRQTYIGLPECIPTDDLHAKRKKIGDKFAFLKRAKVRLAHSPADIRHNNNNPPIEENEVEEDDFVGGIPRSISTLDDQLLLPLLTAPSLDSLGSPCEMMRKNLSLQCGAAANDEESEGKLQTAMQHQIPFFRTNQEESGTGAMLGVVPPCESIEKDMIPQSIASPKNDKATEAELLNILQQAPSLDQLSQYIAALSEEISPDPSGALPSRALRCLFFLSEHSSHNEQRISMVRDVGDNTFNCLLVPALLAYLERCLRKSSEQHLTLMILNNLAIPTPNKRLIALEYGGTKILCKLLIDDPDCQMLVIIILNLAFGDERYPLVDPEDPITCRMVARVVTFLDIWKKRGLPLDFRPLYGVNTGLCTI